MSGQTSAAQSAPAGEREALWQLIHDTLRNYRMSTLVDKDGDGYPLIDALTADSQPVSGGMEECIYLADAVWNAIEAAWQRAQGAVLDVSAMAKVLSDRSADACNIDRTDNWAMYGHEFIDDVQAMLDAPAQPAAQAQGDQQEDLHVWRATSLLGYTCHFGEASAARAWAGENGTIERVDLTPVPDLQVVKRQDQGEVQRLREPTPTMVQAACAAFRMDISPMQAMCEALRAALAAGTGQEVGK